ncbi:hypothetical protein KB1_02740 [Cutibacterium modestum]|uniref:Uncharacterized protein n=2 Tax=Cutibacterium modestum TaxID=2559073 RepID=A0AAD1KNF4_9ACTN|nr:hypothetical protein KB1_02740 [Cutibacterium modestum]
MHGSIVAPRGCCSLTMLGMPLTDMGVDEVRNTTRMSPNPMVSTPFGPTLVIVPAFPTI